VNRLRPYLLSAPAAALLVGLLLGPLVLLLRVSLYEPATGRGFFTPGTWTLANFAAVLDLYGIRLLAFTTAFGIGVAAVSLSVGYPLAMFIRSLSETARRVAVAGVLLPKLASVLVVVFGLQQLLSAAGPVSQSLVVTGVVNEPVTLSRSLFAAVLTEAYLILPYAVLVLLIQLQRIDPTLDGRRPGPGVEAGGRRSAGSRLPLSLPGVDPRGPTRTGVGDGGIPGADVPRWTGTGDALGRSVPPGVRVQPVAASGGWGGRPLAGGRWVSGRLFCLHPLDSRGRRKVGHSLRE
jgi:hypothetical protein